MNYPFKEFAKVGILRQTGKAICKKMAKIGHGFTLTGRKSPCCL